VTVQRFRLDRKATAAQMTFTACVIHGVGASHTFNQKSDVQNPR